MGTFRREQSKAHVYFTDACNNGAVNFVILEVDVVTKDVDLKITIGTGHEATMVSKSSGT